MILNQILHFPPQTCHSYTVFINLLTINFRAAKLIPLSYITLHVLQCYKTLAKIMSSRIHMLLLSVLITQKLTVSYRNVYLYQILFVKLLINEHKGKEEEEEVPYH